MAKQLLTPQQIAEKFIKPTNPFCGTEKRAIADIRKDLVEYIQMAIDARLQAIMEPQKVY